MAKENDDTATTILKRTTPVWWWLRKNFSMPAIVTLLGVAASSAAYIVSLKTRVVVLEHEVTHIVEIVPNTAEIATLKSEVEEHGERLNRLESNYDYAASHAGDAPTTRRKH
jgi:hypothetical protein